VKISLSVISTKREENKKYHLPHLKSVKRQTAMGISDLADSSFAIVDKFDEFEDKNNCYEKQYTGCPFIQYLTVIGTDMKVYTCYDKAYTRKGKIGSIKDKSFQEAWFDSKTKEKLLNLNSSIDLPPKKCPLFRGKINKGHFEFV